MTEQTLQTEKEGRGGKRQGSGRKAIDGEKRVSKTIRFSPKVLEAFAGDGWQTRMNLALEDWLKNNDPTLLKPL